MSGGRDGANDGGRNKKGSCMGLQPFSGEWPAAAFPERLARHLLVICNHHKYRNIVPAATPIAEKESSNSGPRMLRVLRPSAAQHGLMRGGSLLHPSPRSPSLCTSMHDHGACARAQAHLYAVGCPRDMTAGKPFSCHDMQAAQCSAAPRCCSWQRSSALPGLCAADSSDSPANGLLISVSSYSPPKSVGRSR